MYEQNAPNSKIGYWSWHSENFSISELVIAHRAEAVIQCGQTTVFIKVGAYTVCTLGN